MKNLNTYSKKTVFFKTIIKIALCSFYASIICSPPTIEQEEIKDIKQVIKVAKEQIEINKEVIKEAKENITK